MKGSAPIWATTPVQVSRVCAVNSGTFVPKGHTLCCAIFSIITSFGISAQMTAVFTGAKFRSENISRMILSVQSICSFPPLPPAELIISGIFFSYAAEINRLKSFFAAVLLTMAVFAPNLCGPASVEPASTTIASGSSAKPAFSDSGGKP